MPKFQHPASLNAFQQFRQAASILRQTTRASNRAWYQDALEQNFQLHLRSNGDGIATLFHDRKKALWTSGPTLNEDAILDSALLDTFVAEALLAARSNGATSLGVILHIADEFATTELKPEFDNPAALSELRETAVSDPSSILEDASVLADQAAWRVFPYPAAGSEVIGTTITVSKQYAPLLAKLRDAGNAENFPIITHALSAPLVAIMGLSQAITPTLGKSFVCVLQYPWFTALAFFNEYADLRLIRTLQHRGLRRPTNFRNALATTNASLEFVDPDIFILPLGDKVDTSLSVDLKTSFTGSRVEVVEPLRVEGVPAWCPEPVIATRPIGVSQPGTSHTFTIIREEKWALQDFLPHPQEVVEVFPNRTEMRLLRFFRLTRVALFTMAALAVAYFVSIIYDLTRRPEWAYDSAQAELTQKRLAGLTADLQKAAHWNNLFEDRSKAWTNMESLSRMFPENGGMLVKTYSHIAKPENTPGMAKVGIVKEWKITGLARNEALEYLNTLNTREGVSAHFSEIARITGSAAFNPNTGNRNLVINIRTQENSSYKNIPPEESSSADESTYPFTFEMTITQRFEATDPMAIDVVSTKAAVKPRK